MKKIAKRLPQYLVLVVAVALTSCILDLKKESGSSSSSEKKSGKKNGLIKTYYDNGAIRAEVSYKDGKKNGIARDYYKNGKIHIEIPYVNGIKHGTSKMFYETGQLFRTTEYDSGRMHGWQKKYREDGMLSAEIPYNKDQQCMGLKEYLKDGSLKTNYPTIIITPVNTILKDNKYILRISMSDKKPAQFYVGKLEGGCLYDLMDNILMTSSTTGELPFYVPPRTFIMEELNIIARVKTIQGNEYITQRKYNVAVENR
jgi:hypothetical protein